MNQATRRTVVRHGNSHEPLGAKVSPLQLPQPLITRATRRNALVRSEKYFLKNLLATDFWWLFVVLLISKVVNVTWQAESKIVPGGCWVFAFVLGVISLQRSVSCQETLNIGEKQTKLPCITYAGIHAGLHLFKARKNDEQWNKMASLQNLKWESSECLKWKA